MIIFGQPSARNHGKKPKESVHLPPLYVSPNQLTLEGFQTPFDQQLAKDNRWVVLAHLIPWHEVCTIYLKHIGVSSTGRFVEFRKRLGLDNMNAINDKIISLKTKFEALKTDS